MRHSPFLACLSRSTLGVFVGLTFCLGCASDPKLNFAQPERMPASTPVAGADPQVLLNSSLEKAEDVTTRLAEPTDRSLQWPVASARMSRGFLPKKRKPHLGIDLAAPKNTPIYSAHDGLVIYVGRGFKGYGRMVMIESTSGFATLYAHLAKFSAKQGQKVHKGDLIGLMGRSGHATGNHLHFEVRTRKGPVDPIQYLPFTAKEVAASLGQ